MFASDSLDFAAVKSRHDIVSYVSRYTDLRKRGRVYKGLCPFHSERTPSFVVYPDTQSWYCYGACNEGGDIFSFVEKLDGLSRKEAFRQLSGEAISVTPVRREFKPPEPEREAPRELDMRQVDEWHAHFDLALPYFERRAVSEPVAKIHKLGTVIESEHYVKLDGEWHTHSCRRYAIPNIAAGVLRNWNLRRDDEHARQMYAQVDDGVIVAALQCLAQHKSLNPQQVTEAMLIDLLFGPKYKQARKDEGARPGIFNADLLLQLGEDGQPLRDQAGRVVMQQLDYCLIVEGEIDAMSLVSAGYPAVAAKPFVNAINFERAFARVRWPIYVADNDANGAGQAHAEKVIAAIGRGQIVHPPADYKDANDVVVDGVVHNWLQEIEIERKFPS